MMLHIYPIGYICIQSLITIGCTVSEWWPGQCSWDGHTNKKTPNKINSISPERRLQETMDHTLNISCPCILHTDTFVCSKHCTW